MPLLLGFAAPTKQMWSLFQQVHLLVRERLHVRLGLHGHVDVRIEPRQTIGQSDDSRDCQLPMTGGLQKVDAEQSRDDCVVANSANLGVHMDEQNGGSRRADGHYQTRNFYPREGRSKKVVAAFKPLVRIRTRRLLNRRQTTLAMHAWGRPSLDP